MSFSPRCLIRSSKTTAGVTGSISNTAIAHPDPLELNVFTSNYVQHPTTTIGTPVAGSDWTNGVALYGGATENNSLGSMPAIQYNASTLNGNAFRSIACPAASTTNQGIRFTINIGTTPKTFKLSVCSINFSGSSHVRVRATLSDGSASPVTTTMGGAGNLPFLYTITANAASAGRTLLIEMLPDASDGGQIALGGFYTNTP